MQPAKGEKTSKLVLPNTEPCMLQFQPARQNLPIDVIVASMFIGVTKHNQVTNLLIGCEIQEGAHTW